MIRLRRRLGAVAMWWLCGQMALLTVSGIVLSSVSDDAVCTCAQTGGAMCPMHHHKRPLGSPHCAIQSATTEPPTPTIWFGTPGVIARPTVAIASAPVRGAVARPVVAPTGSSSRPELPPPRT